MYICNNDNRHTFSINIHSHVFTIYRHNSKKMTPIQITLIIIKINLRMYMYNTMHLNKPEVNSNLITVKS